MRTNSSTITLNNKLINKADNVIRNKYNQQLKQSKPISCIPIKFDENFTLVNIVTGVDATTNRKTVTLSGYYDFKIQDDPSISIKDMRIISLRLPPIFIDGAYHIAFIEFPMPVLARQDGSSFSPDIDIRAKSSTGKGPSRYTKDFEAWVVEMNDTITLTTQDLAKLAGCSPETIDRIIHKNCYLNYQVFDRVQTTSTNDMESTQLVEASKSDVSSRSKFDDFCIINYEYDWSGIRRLQVDEFYYATYYKCLTSILDSDTGVILYMSTSKRKNIIDDFFKIAPINLCQQIEVVGCDMNAGFASVFKLHNIPVSYDRFHIVKNLNEAKNSELKKLRRDAKNSKDENKESMLKGSKYLILQSNQSLEEAKRKAEMIVINQNLSSNNIPLFLSLSLTNTLRKKDLLDNFPTLKDGDIVTTLLEQAYASSTEEEMRACLTKAIEVCKDSKSEYLQKFGTNILENKIDDIVKEPELRINSAMIEGTNRKMRTLQSIHYGMLNIRKKMCELMYSSNKDIKKRWNSTKSYNKKHNVVVYSNNNDTGALMVA